MNTVFETRRFFKVLLKWKVVLISAFVLSFVLSAIFSGPSFIKPKYKSIAVMYPDNLRSFSNETPSEQMLQFLEADDIRNQIIEKFQLFKHYEIDTIDNLYFKTDVLKEFESNVSFKKNKYEAVELEVLDYSPDTAHQMVLSIIDLYNDKVREIQNFNKVEIVGTLEGQLERKRIEMDSLDKQMTFLRKRYNILDYGNQVKYLAKKNKLSGGSKPIRNDSIITNLKDKGGLFIATQAQLWSVRSDYNSIKVGYENAKKELERKLKYAHIIEDPFVADKKSYPVRWIIVLLAVGTTMLLVITLISIYEQQLLNN